MNDLKWDKWYGKRDSSAAQRKLGPKWIARKLNHKQNFDSVTEGIQEHMTLPMVYCTCGQKKTEIKCIRLHYDLNLQQ